MLDLESASLRFDKATSIQMHAVPGTDQRDHLCLRLRGPTNLSLVSS